MTASEPRTCHPASSNPSCAHRSHRAMEGIDSHCQGQRLLPQNGLSKYPVPGKESPMWPLEGFQSTSSKSLYYTRKNEDGAREYPDGRGKLSKQTSSRMLLPICKALLFLHENDKDKCRLSLGDKDLSFESPGSQSRQSSGFRFPKAAKYATFRASPLHVLMKSSCCLHDRHKLVAHLAVHGYLRSSFSELIRKLQLLCFVEPTFVGTEIKSTQSQSPTKVHWRLKFKFKPPKMSPYPCPWTTEIQIFTHLDLKFNPIHHSPS